MDIHTVTSAFLADTGAMQTADTVRHRNVTSSPLNINANHKADIDGKTDRSTDSEGDDHDNEIEIVDYVASEHSDNGDDGNELYSCRNIQEAGGSTSGHSTDADECDGSRSTNNAVDILKPLASENSKTQLTSFSKSWSPRQAHSIAGPSNDSGRDISNNGPKSSQMSENVLSGHRVKKRHYGRRNSEPAPSSSSFANFLASSRQAAIRAEDWMLHVITASWHLVHHQMLPDWLQDNEHLHTGHRLPLNSFRACFQSIFRIHTETGNIWTHLIGMLAFICIAAYTLSSRYIDWMWQDITVHSVFLAGAILCLTFSWIFHTVFCHSESVNKLFSKLDYCGIALLTVSSFVPWLYYGFYNHRIAHLIYLVAIIILGTSCIVVSLFDTFSAPAYRFIRAGLFVALGLTGIIPAIHFVLLEGFRCAVFEFAFLHLMIMAVLYIGGALMYAFRVPESIWPGRFDIWFQSHQLFHICVILAALVHFQGIQIISHARLTSVQCAHA